MPSNLQGQQRTKWGGGKDIKSLVQNENIKNIHKIGNIYFYDELEWPTSVPTPSE